MPETLRRERRGSTIKYMSVFDTIVHRWLHIPYTLHVRKFRSPKNPRATIVLIHGLGNSAESWRGVTALLPEDVRVIAVDMLGFGQSPKPTWVKYSISVQARAVAHTLLGLRLTQRPIVVGHSMGALVAVELARRYPLVLKQLVLCSPPLYKANSSDWLGREKLLKEFYKIVTKHPAELEKIAPVAKQLGIVSKVFNVKGDYGAVYVAALESSIINQSSLDDVRRLSLPIRILYGAFDPVIIGANIQKIDNQKPNITTKVLPVGHEMLGTYVQFIASELKKIITTN